MTLRELKYSTRTKQPYMCMHARVHVFKWLVLGVNNV